jgi:hypothetical protein
MDETMSDRALFEKADWRITFSWVVKNCRRGVKIIQIGLLVIITETSQTVHRPKPTGTTRFRWN